MFSSQQIHTCLESILRIKKFLKKYKIYAYFPLSSFAPFNSWSAFTSPLVIISMYFANAMLGFIRPCIIPEIWQRLYPIDSQKSLRLFLCHHKYSFNVFIPSPVINIFSLNIMIYWILDPSVLIVPNVLF